MSASEDCSSLYVLVLVYVVSRPVSGKESGKCALFITLVLLTTRNPLVSDRDKERDGAPDTACHPPPRLCQPPTANSHLVRCECPSCVIHALYCSHGNNKRLPIYMYIPVFL